MEINGAELSMGLNEEGAGRVKAIIRRRAVFAVIARVLPWLRYVVLGL